MDSDRIVLISKYNFGKLVIKELVAPSWVYNSQYDSNENVLVDRRVCDIIKCMANTEYFERERYYLGKAGRASSKEFGYSRDMYNVMKHAELALLITTGNLREILSVDSLSRSDTLFPYLSQVIEYNGKSLSRDLWSNVAIALTALVVKRDFDMPLESKYWYEEEIQQVISATTDWPQDNRLALEWAIEKALAADTEE